MGRLELGEWDRARGRAPRSEKGWDSGHWEGLGAALPDQCPASMAVEEWSRTGASPSPLAGEIGREESIDNEPPDPEMLQRQPWGQDESQEGET